MSPPTTLTAKLLGYAHKALMKGVRPAGIDLAPWVIEHITKDLARLAIKRRDSDSFRWHADRLTETFTVAGIDPRQVLPEDWINPTLPPIKPQDVGKLFYMDHGPGAVYAIIGRCAEHSDRCACVATSGRPDDPRSANVSRRRNKATVRFLRTGGYQDAPLGGKQAKFALITFAGTMPEKRSAKISIDQQVKLMRRVRRSLLRRLRKRFNLPKNALLAGHDIIHAAGSGKGRRPKDEPFAHIHMGLWAYAVVPNKDDYEIIVLDAEVVAEELRQYAVRDWPADLAWALGFKKRTEQKLRQQMKAAHENAVTRHPAEDPARLYKVARYDFAKQQPGWVTSAVLAGHPKALALTAWGALSRGHRKHTLRALEAAREPVENDNEWWSRVYEDYTPEGLVHKPKRVGPPTCDRLAPVTVAAAKKKGHNPEVVECDSTGVVWTMDECGTELELRAVSSRKAETVRIPRACDESPVLNTVDSETGAACTLDAEKISAMQRRFAGEVPWPRGAQPLPGSKPPVHLGDRHPFAVPAGLIGEPKSRLTSVQAAALVAVQDPTRGFAVLHGNAGSGKTEVAHHLAYLAQVAGRPVVLLAHQAITAENLSLRIGSTRKCGATVSRFMHSIWRDEIPDQDCLVILDEVPRTPNVLLRHLIRAVGARGGQVVGVGDPGQGVPIGEQRKPYGNVDVVATLTGNHRTDNPGLLRVAAKTAQIRDKVMQLAEHSQEAAADCLLTFLDWVIGYGAGEGWNVVHRRADQMAAYIDGHNDMIWLSYDHEVKHDILGCGDLCVGDRIVIRRNAYQYKVLNGHTGLVIELRDNGWIEFLPDGAYDFEQILIPAEFASTAEEINAVPDEWVPVDRGEIRTVTSMQGAEADKVGFLLSDAFWRLVERDPVGAAEQLHVAVTRARKQLYFVVVEQNHP